MCGVPYGFILGPLLFLIYVKDMSQAVKSNLFLYADDSCLIYQHREISIHFGEDKIKSILFASRLEIKNARKLNVKYKNKTEFAGYISWLCFG